ncbi:diphosphomevalonate decarboxylase [Orbilia oligospora]|uniref:Diphosphomevalonate decarboxylase n=1 Tax=Orbilia oligospora TaxID=2813651 RepID=A0A6G1M0V2_ORBOL|nr:diphosphomevalonate decarboxylase [Orbilia oligospora]KAF3201482.1 diphosphomevalonate decarboxylase [Orbilia oligospora]KAF3204407.1 diphosphomevalonate decarboxylase [Orbilia oligospora]KAF3214291.1 diphosphomevalonate decarboxylase [Orbilia oligospora]KAF3241436.1 diphosphomevalonate decarboxylase [Orbilia oligospora]
MANPSIYHATATAPVNIAVIKYWGKASTKLNTPTNSSLSVTLSQDDLRTITTASCSASFESDALWLNGTPHDVSNARSQACFAELRALRKAKEDKDSSLPPLSTYKLHLISENNFPTAAGLASSAAGFAAFVRAIADLYELDESPTELSRIARQGSGSACRSLFGGYVAWEKGDREDGQDSLAVQIESESHWPTMRAAILVISDAKKGVSSTSGMQATVATSTLFPNRANVVVPARMEAMKRAIVEKDFETFAELTMADSNSFHAVCLDTIPPIFYMNDTSRAAVRVVEEINRSAGKKVAAYTFDAGPNAVIYYDEANQDLVLGTLKKATANVTGWSDKYTHINAAVPEGFNEAFLEPLAGGVSRVILTGVGSGPLKVPKEKALIDEQGNPRSAT